MLASNITLLSQLIISNPEIMSFSELIKVIQGHGKTGATMLQIDIKPDYRDTPKDWESQVEVAFSWGK